MVTFPTTVSPHIRDSEDGEDQQKACNFDVSFLISRLLMSDLWSPRPETARGAPLVGYAGPNTPRSPYRPPPGCLRLHHAFEYDRYDCYQPHKTYLNFRIRRRPLHIVAVIDCNRSMAMHGKLDLCRTTFKRIIRRLTRHDSVSVCTWNSGLVAFPPTEASEEGITKLYGYIDSVHPPTAPETASTLFRAVKCSLERMREVGPSVHGSHRRVLLLCTDGGEPSATTARSSRHGHHASRASASSSGSALDSSHSSTPSPPGTPHSRTPRSKGGELHDREGSSGSNGFAAGSTQGAGQASPPHTPTSRHRGHSFSQEPAPPRHDITNAIEDAKVLLDKEEDLTVLSFEFGGSAYRQALEKIIKGGGSYFHVGGAYESTEEATNACMALLTAAKADQVVVTVEAQHGCSIEAVTGAPGAAVSTVQENIKYSVNLGQLMNEQVKDVPFMVSLPTTTTAAATVWGSVELDYQDLMTGARVQLRTQLEVPRYSSGKKSSGMADLNQFYGSFGGLSSTRQARNCDIQPKKNPEIQHALLRIQSAEGIAEAWKIFEECSDLNAAKQKLEDLLIQLKQFELENSSVGTDLAVHHETREVKSALQELTEEHEEDQDIGSSRRRSDASGARLDMSGDSKRRTSGNLGGSRSKRRSTPQANAIPENLSSTGSEKSRKSSVLGFTLKSRRDTRHLISGQAPPEISTALATTWPSPSPSPKSRSPKLSFEFGG